VLYISIAINYATNRLDWHGEQTEINVVLCECRKTFTKAISDNILNTVQVVVVELQSSP